jgi:hypothetical protein
LHQANPFSGGLEDEETGTIVHELTSREVAPTAEEIQAIADEEEDEQALPKQLILLLQQRGLVGQQRHLIG